MTDDEQPRTMWVATLEGSTSTLHVIVGARDIWLGDALLFMQDLARTVRYPLEEVPADWVCSKNHECRVFGE